jgi:ABC-type branched-subunit amino acid transport system substrate-binding protein
MAKQMTKSPDPINFPAIGLAGAEAIEPVLLKALSIRREDRYQSVAEFKGALEAILTSILSNTERNARQMAETAKNAAQATLVNTPQAKNHLRVHSRQRRSLLLGAGLVGVAACALVGWLTLGGKRGSDTANKARAALTATAPGVTPTEVVLGLSAPFSGPAKELGRAMQTGIETYLRYVNESDGGIHGRKLRLLALDDGYDPKRCALTMKEMIDDKPVFAFIGNVGTPTAEAALPVVLQHKPVFFGAFTGAGLLRRDPPDRYVFNYRASYAEETAAIVQYLLTLRKIKPDEIAVFAQQDGYGDAGYSGVAKALRKVGHESDRILRIGYERNSLDLDAAVRKLLDHKDRIKAVIMVPTYQQAAAFIKRVRDGGMKPIFSSVSFVGSEALAEALGETAPQYAEGVIVTQVVPFYRSSATAVLQYREHLAQFFPEAQPGFVSLEGYIAAKLLCAALDAAGPQLTTDKLVEALEATHNLDFGLGTPLSFGPSEHQASHKVWATILDSNAQFRDLELD